jgi:hypothetical protein
MKNKLRNVVIALQFWHVRSVIPSRCLELRLFKSTIFWDIMPCSPLSVNRRFGGTYRLIFRGEKISSARNQREDTGLATAFTLVP